MDKTSEFIDAIKEAIKKRVPVQVVWATCQSVDWDDKTMVAVGITDELEYDPVLIGLGSEYKEPVVGSKCLIGVIQNNAVATYLIHADEVERHLIVDNSGFEWLLKDGALTMNGDQFGGLIKIQELEDNLNALKSYVQALKAAVDAGLNGVGSSPAANGPAGATTFNGAMAGQTINFSDMENPKIKHG